MVEIGTGWGGFALHAARHYGCRVTTTTISREQHALARERVAAAGLADRIDVRLDDYRDLTGQYDKLVSIEMIEAIGAPYLETYFATLDRLLKPDGLALMQAITIEDHRYRQALRSVDFIKRHIFPGSFIPSVRAMLAAKTRASRLGLVALQDFGDSYARTLEAWRRRFLARLPEVRAQGFDERFIRMWEFYLAYCEGGFRERSIGVAHLLLAQAGLAAHPRGSARGFGRVKFWITLVAYELVWFAAVIGAGHGLVWPGVVATMVFALWRLAGSTHRRVELKLIAVALLLGVILEGIWGHFGLIRYAAPWPLPSHPAWLMALWAAFALTVVPLFGYLHARPWLAAAFGAVGGPLAYLGAARGWHAVLLLLTAVAEPARAGGRLGHRLSLPDRARPALAPHA